MAPDLPQPNAANQSRPEPSPDNTEAMQSAAADQSPAVLGFGAVAVDEFLYVDRFPAADSKVRVRRRLRQCGGLTGTALVAAARLGASCSYVGVLSDDPLSQEVVACFRREGIVWDQHARVAEARPAHSTIVVDQTSHTRTIFSSVDGPLGAAPDWPEADTIRRARVILVDHHGMQGTLRAIRIAREAEVAVVADFERNPGGNFDDVLRAVDHLIVSRRFAAELTGHNDPVRSAVALWNAGRRCVAVTCGAEGSWYVDAPDPATARHQPAFPVDVVDTTGCGDVFHGAYAAALCQNSNLVECLRTASAAAALSAMGHGGQSAIPTREPLRHLLAQHGV